LLAAISEQRLLSPAELAEVASWKSTSADARTLAKELVQRRWLTLYQVNQLLQGLGRTLVLGSYILLDRLGEGGMGEVFRARHRKLDRIVALKIVRKDQLADPEAIRRFHREIHAAAQLAHPNIVHAFDADQVGDIHFFVMEYVEGMDLRRLVKEQGPLPPAEACDYIRQAALGLQHAHERGLVHRDIKPSNLMLVRRQESDARRQESDARRQESDLGGQQTTVALIPDPAPLTPVVKILDMGLARLTETEPSAETCELTRTGVVMGTADYMAPEQSEDSHHADIRADIYSLGCTFYFLLTGQVPFPGGTYMNKIFRHQMEQPAPVEKFRPDAPAAVAAVIRRMMAKQPQNRYRTPTEVVAAIDALAKPPEQPTSTGATAIVLRRPTAGAAVPPDPFGDLLSDSTAKPMRPQRRPSPSLNMLLAASGLAAALFFAGLLAFLLRPGGKAEKKPAAAEQKDAAANLQLGRFLCLSEERWPVGLPLLVKSGDPLLAEAAKLELARPTDAPAYIKAGDAWKAVFDREPQNHAVAQRARAWYDLALSELPTTEASTQETRKQLLTKVRQIGGAPNLTLVKPFFVADASDPNSGFPVHQFEKDYGWDSGFAKGRWFMKTQAGYWFGTEVTRFSPPFACQVVARVEPPNAAWDLIFFIAKKHSHKIRVNGEGSVQVLFHDDRLNPETLFTHIAKSIKPHAGFDTFLIVGRSRQLDLYVNGAPLTPVMLQHDIGPGGIDFGVTAANPGGGHLEVKRLTLWPAEGVPALGK
jgi:serine/threonine-protein kinase